MTATTEFILPQVDTPSCLVLVFMAVFALQDLMFVPQWPARELVVETFLASLDRAPPHHVKATALVIEMAVGAGFAPYFGRCVIAKPRPNALLQILMVVAVKTLVAVHCLAVIDVAVVALVIELSMFLGQWPWA